MIRNVKMRTQIKIKCWAAISEDGEFMFARTREEAKRCKRDARGFDVEMKVKKAMLTILYKN